jgi:hypothetical protein
MWTLSLSGLSNAQAWAAKRSGALGVRVPCLPPEARAWGERSACNRADLGYVSTADQVRIQVNRGWSANQITLDLVAGFLGQEVEFALGFHTLSDDRKVQSPLWGANTDPEGLALTSRG